MVRKDVKDISTVEKWIVKLDVRDLGGHLDTTFRGWSAALAARVRLVNFSTGSCFYSSIGLPR